MVTWDPHCLRLQGLWLKIVQLCSGALFKIKRFVAETVQLCGGALLKITRLVAETVQLCGGAAPGFG